MREACAEFELSRKTRFHAVALFDMVMPEFDIPQHKVEHVALACIMISAKFHEVDLKVPSAVIMEVLTLRRVSA